MIDRLKPYPSYKDSGVPWLGEMPGHWQVGPAFAAYRPKLIKNTGMAETTVLSLSHGQIIVRSADKLHGLVPESFETYQIVEPGNIIVRTTDLQNDQTSLRVGIARQRGIITSAYLCLQVRDGLSSDFGYLLLSAYDLLKVLYGYGSGLRQNLDFSHIKRMPVLVPTPDEQSAIVHFLDHADRRIRRYIRAKKKLIALLNEQKQAIIHRGVTRGLDPNVRLKPSGVEWLGDVPEHWEVHPAKHFYREVDDRSSTGMEELLSVSHITGVTPRSQKSITMFMAESYVGHKLCRRGDLVINTMWAWMGALGVAKRVGIVSPSYAVYRPVQHSKLLGDYADLLLRTRPCINEYTRRSTGIRSSRLRLYPEQFLRIKLVCPPAEEQRCILDCVATETGATERAMERTQREIDLLHEYRTRLIADVVTGKLDVRQAAAGLPDETEEPEPLGDSDAITEDDEAGDDMDLEAAPEEAEA